MIVILGVVRSGRASTAPFAVGGYTAAAYWFTSSKSFANPAVTIASTLSDTFAGTKPSSAPAFIVAQLVGGTASVALARFLYPDLPPAEIVVPTIARKQLEEIAMPDLEDFTVEQRRALHSAASNLNSEFDGVLGEETIELFRATSYGHFARNATVHTFVPPRAERFARQRLKALAKVEGKANDGLPMVLFLCVHNAGRSQMALGWFNPLAGARAIAWSRGSEPGTEVNPSAIAAMAEVGIDITQEFPKPWTDEIVKAADVVVSMGFGDAYPMCPGKRYEDWVLDDPAGRASMPSARSETRSAKGYDP